MLFDDVAADALELGPDSPDRALFACIGSKGDLGDLPVDETWAILADRYGDDARLRVLAIAREIEAHGTAEGRSAEDYARAIDALRPRIDEALAEPFEALEVFRQDALGRAADETFRRARRTLRRFEQALLEEAAERTSGGRPFGERSSGTKVVDDATLLANATGEPRPYSPKTGFAVGDRVSHTKFGLGLVVAREEAKIEVVFAEGRKKLASA
jgi:hypothetical protein